MGRSRYIIHEIDHPHFVTCTVLHWIPIFTRPESVQILLDSLKHLQENDDLKVHAYVILENHLHIVVQSGDLPQSLRKFKSYTAKKLIELLQRNNVTTILDQLAFYKKAHKKTAEFQVWQEGYQPKLIQSEQMMRERIEYIHNNPIKRGYVDEAKHWRYSSARDYEGEAGLLPVDRFW